MALRVGTDFSGMETPILALRNLGVDFTHIFSSDNEPACERLIRYHFKPEHFYNDMLARKPKETPACDVYCFCAPCQKFSTAGSRTGESRFLKAAARYIACKRPRVVVSENVRAVLFKKYSHIIRKLIKLLAKLGYTISHRILNSCNHGVPQHRRRWYLVAIRTSALKMSGRKFKWPKAIAHPPASSLLDPRAPKDSWKRKPKTDRARQLVKKALINMKARGLNPATDACFIDIGCSLRYAQHKHEMMMTMTKTRAQGFAYWISARGRPLSLGEMCKFQGIDLTQFDLPRCGVSEQQFAAMLGNGLTLNVVQRVLSRALFAAGLVD